MTCVACGNLIYMNTYQSDEVKGLEGKVRTFDLSAAVVTHGTQRLQHRFLAYVKQVINNLVECKKPQLSVHIYTITLLLFFFARK